jgi:hypothetical protein
MLGGLSSVGSHNNIFENGTWNYIRYIFSKQVLLDEISLLPGGEKA